MARYDPKPGLTVREFFECVIVVFLVFWVDSCVPHSPERTACRAAICTPECPECPPEQP